MQGTRMGKWDWHDHALVVMWSRTWVAIRDSIGQKLTQQAIEIRVKPTLAVNMCDPIRTRSMFHVRHSRRDGVMPVNANVELQCFRSVKTTASLGDR